MFIKFFGHPYVIIGIMQVVDCVKIVFICIIRMVVLFTKQNSNYHQQNLIDLLFVSGDPLIAHMINDPDGVIQIIGDIHYSQWTHDNPNHYYWFKVTGLYKAKIVPELEAVHVYVCFRKLNKFSQPMECINPPRHPGSDAADIRGLRGYWEYRGISYKHMSHLPLMQILQPPQTQQIKVYSKSRSLKITDPKTGKAIEI